MDSKGLLGGNSPGLCFNPQGFIFTKSAGLAACHSKALKEARLVERKVCFILDASNPRVGVGGRTPVQRPTAPPRWQPVGKSFYRQREGATGRNSTVSSDRHLEIGHRWSDQRHLDCFKYNSSSLPGLVCPIFLRPILGIVAAYVMATVWPSCS